MANYPFVATGTPLDWVAVRPSGDATGASDTANINAALTAAPTGGVVYLPRGIYFINAPIVMSTPNVSLVGDGLGNTNRTGSTVITPVAAFAGTAAITITTTGFGCQVQNLSVLGATTTATNNPQANGIELTGVKFVNLVNLFFQYLNGWCIEAVGNATQGCLGLSVLNVTGYNSAGGFHGKGVTGSNFAGQYSLTDMQFSQIGVATGPNANLDCIEFEDIDDILTLNTNCAVSSASTGATIHIHGACTTHVHTNVDIGVFPTAGTANSVILIDDSVNGSPSQCVFQGGVAQAGAVALTVNGGGNQLTFDNLLFKNNQTHGVVLGGTGSQIDFRTCTWGLNGQGATGTNYDMNVSGTPNGTVRLCRFTSPVVTTGTAGVQGVVNIGTSGQAIPFTDCQFNGTGTTIATSFPTNLPSVIRNSFGYNPHGSVGPAVPASGTATAGLHYDAMFYITANAAGSCTIVRNTGGQGGGGGPTITIPASACVPVWAPALTTITPTYTNAPTWVVDGA